MHITLKCFASLAPFLPAHAKANVARVEINKDMSVHQVIDFFKIDRKEAYLVILNGIFIFPADRDSTILVENDILALWPKVAGG